MPTFDLSTFGKDLLTRDQGALVSAALEKNLPSFGGNETLVVDLGRVEAITPSFVDECLGRLLLEIGIVRFKRSIELRAPEEATRRLVNSVLAHRASELATRKPTK